MNERTFRETLSTGTAEDSNPPQKALRKTTFLLLTVHFPVHWVM